MKQIKMTRKSEITLETAMDLFVKKCQAQNLSPASIQAYKDKLKPFILYVGKDRPVQTLSPKILENYTLKRLKEDHLSSISIATNLRHIRAFLYYCMDCSYVKRFKVIIPKAEKKIKQTYSNSDLERLLKRPDMNSCSFTEYKVWVFENYLLATGNRISTALSIKIRDIDFENNVIQINKVKNRRQQIIPLSHTLAEILQEYLMIRGNNPDDYLFCCNSGEKSAVRTYQELVQNYNTMRNVECTSCHAFRHTLAKNWILSGGDIARLKTILGHSNISVTNEYLQMFGQDLQMDFEKFNPLDQISRSNARIRM